MKRKSFAIQVHRLLCQSRLTWAIILAIVLNALALGCLLPPRGAGSRIANQSAGQLRVQSDDSTTQRVFCQRIARSGCFRQVHCGASLDGGSPALDANVADQTTPTLFVTTHVKPGQSQWWQDTLHSLKLATTGLQISRRAPVEFTVLIRAGSHTDRSTWRTEGRAGLYAYLPFYTGLFGTWMGNALAESLEPAELRRSCDYHGLKCTEYQNFLEDALFEAGPDFRRAMGRLGCAMSEREV